MYDLTKTEKWIYKKDGIIIFAVNAFLVKRMKEISWILFNYVILFNLKNVHRVFFHEFLIQFGAVTYVVAFSIT